jgi:hydroxymethylbilane synthase
LKEIIVGTRGAELALWQAEFIKSCLEPIRAVPVRIEVIKTQGDKLDQLAFDKIEGKGFFTKEIEDALLAGQIDLAVHSLKDLMTTMPEGLKLAAVGFREDSREIVLINKAAYDPTCPLNVKSGSAIGSSSVRRQCQIAESAPELILKDIRGNVPTRVRKLREGQYDAIILAYAGVKRLGLDLSDLEVVILPHEQFLPAPGQGILAAQTRENDDTVNSIVSQLDDPEIRLQARLERGLLARFAGGCQLPLGTYSQISGGTLVLHAILGRRKEDRWVGLARASKTGKDPDKVVGDAYEGLVSQQDEYA